MDWKGNSMVFKGYATGTGKKATMKVKDAQLLQWDDVGQRTNKKGVG